ncbi:MAG: CD225/dispanin family protein [Firmicutes bacterium]|nr:CD225/dispanin family protein [Bacillota bacterium]MCM1400605.1 CD225/dispanin family protein [Bacteroides sp.]MCM1476316.1 CD225/dispanin family protein [Bacteroides sp.]
MNYWIVIDRQKFGPLTLEEVRRMPLKRDSLVWHTGLPTWVHAEAVPELAGLFRAEEPEAVCPEHEEVQTQAAPTYVAPPPPAPLRRPAPPAPPVRPPKPPTYFGWCVASIILCCLIPGIVAVIYSSKVTTYYERGQYAEAQKASESAELWLILAFTLGLVAAPFQFLFSLM